MASQDMRVQVVLQAIDQATGPIKKILGGTQGLAQGIRESTGALKSLQAQQKQLTAFRELKNQTDSSSTAFKAAQQRVNTLRTAMAGMESPTRKSTAALAQAERAAEKLKQSHVGNLQALRNSRNALTAAGIGARDFGNAEKQLQSKIQSTTAALRQQQQQLKNIETVRKRSAAIHSAGIVATAHGAGAAYAGQRMLRTAAAPVAAAMEFESAMADVKKVVDFDTPEQFQQMERDIQDLSLKLPMTTVQISQIVAAAGQANIPRKELLRFAEDTVKMGVAFDSTAEGAGQTMATWRTAFRMTQDEVIVLADQINYLGNTGPASVQKISAIVNKIGALGEVAGLGSGTLAALGATIAGMGIEENVAATGIKKVLLTLGAGTVATKRQKNAMAALGLDTGKMAKAMQEDASEAILSVLEKVKTLKPEEQTSILTQLFGSESVAAIAPMLNNLELLKDNLEKVNNAKLYAGSMDKEYISRVATSENAMNRPGNIGDLIT